MGMFDDVHFGSRCTQTKAFGRRSRQLYLGDRVEICRWTSSFEPVTPITGDGQVLTFGLGWLIVRDGVLTDWTYEPVPDLDWFSHGGEPWSEEQPTGSIANALDPTKCRFCIDLRSA